MGFNSLPQLEPKPKKQKPKAEKVPKPVEATSAPIEPEDKHGLTEEEWIAAHKDDPDFDPEEFKFHQARYQKKAEDFARRNVLRKFFDGFEEKDNVAFAYEEAIRDNEEWNKMFHLEMQTNGEFRKEMNAEFKEWHKMLETVLGNLKTKRDDPDGKGKEVRPLLLALGGGMAGSYGAGQVAALVHSGYMKTFNQAVGISAGSCDIGYALGGEDQVLTGSSIYYEECAKKEFLDMGRLKQIMNMGYLAEVFDHGDKKLDTDAIQANPTEFYVQATNVTDPENQRAEFIDAKEKGIIPSIHASMALPWFYRKSVEIDGQQFQDGALIDSFPLEEIIKRFNPTDILVLPQVPFETMVGIEQETAKFRSKTMSFFARFLPNRASLESGSVALFLKFVKSRENFRKALERIQGETGVNIGLMYPPDGGLIPITNEPGAVKAGILASAKRACEDLGEAMNFKLK